MYLLQICVVKYIEIHPNFVQKFIIEFVKKIISFLFLGSVNHLKSRTVFIWPYLFWFHDGAFRWCFSHRTSSNFHVNTFTWEVFDRFIIHKMSLISSVLNWLKMVVHYFAFEVNNQQLCVRHIDMLCRYTSCVLTHHVSSCKCCGRCIVCLDCFI